MHAKSYLPMRIDEVKHGLGNMLNGGHGQIKIGGAHIYIMWAMQYIDDNLLKRHRACWALHAKWYPSLRIVEEKVIN